MKFRRQVDVYIKNDNSWNCQVTLFINGKSIDNIDLGAHAKRSLMSSRNSSYASGNQFNFKD